MTFNVAEKYQSQVPALQLLVAMGYRPLSQDEVVRLRGGRLRNVVLDEALAEQLLKINRFRHRGKDYAFDLEDAYEAIWRLKPTPDRLKGLKATNQDVYDTLVLGTTITKTIDGDSKSYSFRYVDWDEPDNNVFHVTAEMEVERTASTKSRRCDIVCFVNGIPFVVIENKRPTEDPKKAHGQLIKYQGESNIPQLFHFAQLLMSMNRLDARYATVGTPKRFWQSWRHEDQDESSVRALAARGLEEPESDILAAAIEPAQESPSGGGGPSDAEAEELSGLVNTPMGVEEEKAVFSGPMTSAKDFFRKLAAAGEREVTAQDRTLHALCRPERLLDLVRRFTVFEGGERKIARHPQYFGILAAIDRVKAREASGRRKGGVIWHTQGSGKSLTMVMLGRALALDPAIENPRIIIVTDRDDLDKQIKGTFKSCDMEPVRATSGPNLGALIRAKTPLITTIINKFHTLTKADDLVDRDPNIFVLVDESHRSQTGPLGGFGQFAMRMRRILPSACYLGFTGTPLLKKEKNTLATFGGLVHRYAIDEAIEDGAVVPLLYEGRLVEQEVTGGAVDKWFEKISQNLTETQKADLKRKYSRMDALGKTEQAIRAKAFDISEHYRQHWQGTGFKAQLVAPSKAAAVRFKEILDEIGHVTSEIVISPPDENEGSDEVDKAAKEKVQAFWDAMMARYGTEEAYNRDIIDAFKSGDDPEILIVVSKLLTGFDAPRNTVLYVCKPLRDHTLLQAIARVNRLYEDEEKGQEKQFGFIIDYEGLLGDLDKALTTYSAFEGYDPEDVRGVVEDVREQIRKLPGLHEHLWDHFKTVENKNDMEQFELFLADEARREEFYARLKAFGRCLHIAMSSDKVLDVIEERTLETMKRDLKRFAELRRSVQIRYQEVIDMKEYEPKIRKLLDDHVTAAPAQTIIDPVNINDPDSLNKVIEETGVTAASKADRIASATRRAITEKMEEDPAFYRRFSEMLEQTIRDYRERRLSEKEYLNTVTELAGKVARKEHDGGVPASLKGDEDAQAFFGVLNDALGASESAGDKTDGGALDDEEVAGIARAVLQIIKDHHIVDVWSNDIARGKMQNAIDDYFFDVVRDEKGVSLAPEQLDDLQQKILDLARARFPG